MSVEIPQRCHNGCLQACVKIQTHELLMPPIHPSFMSGQLSQLYLANVSDHLPNIFQSCPQTLHRFVVQLMFSLCYIHCTPYICMYSYEPRHDKTNKMSVRPSKIQISLGIRWAHTHFVGFVMSRLICIYSYALFHLHITYRRLMYISGNFVVSSTRRQCFCLCLSFSLSRMWYFLLLVLLIFVSTLAFNSK